MFVQLDGWTRLHVAANRGWPQLTQILLSHNAAVNCTNNVNLLAAHIIIQQLTALYVLLRDPEPRYTKQWHTNTSE